MNPFHKGRRVGLAALMLLMLVAGAARAQSPLQVTVILPLTGNGAFLGQGQQRTLQALQAQVNKDGGVGGRQLEFVYRDDQSSPQVTVQLTNAAVAQRPAVLLGSSLVAMCNAMVPLVRNGPFTYCLSPAIQPAAGGYMYSSGTSTHDLLAADFRYFRSRGWTRVALISSTDATGQDFRFCQRSRQRCRHTPVDAVSLCSLEDGEHGGRATEMKHAAAVGGNLLVVTYARTEVIAEFVISSTEAAG